MITNKDIKSISGYLFTMGKRTPKNDIADIFNNQRYYFKSSLIISILIITLLFLIFPKFDIPPKEVEAPVIVLEIKDIPPTKNPGRRAPKPPSRPFVPVESDVAVLEEELVEKWDDVNNIDLPGLPGVGGYGGTTGKGVSTKVNPRPILEVVPEYDEKEIEKGKKGYIKLFIQIDSKGKVVSVDVIENTTGSKILEKAVIDATFKTRYTPAKVNGKPVADDITRTYTFNLADDK